MAALYDMKVPEGSYRSGDHYPTLAVAIPARALILCNMTVLLDGFTVLLNGFVVLFSALFSWMFLVIIVIALGFGWMAIIELEELNRQSFKPETPLH